MYVGFMLCVLFVYDLTTVERCGQCPFTWGLRLLNENVRDDYVKHADRDAGKPASDCTFHVWQHIRNVA